MKKDFTDRLKALRGGETLRTFSERIGVSLKTYEHYESGRRKPPVEFILQIVETCGVSADWLLGIEKIPRGHIHAENSIVAQNGNASGNHIGRPDGPARLKKENARLREEKDRLLGIIEKLASGK